MNWNGWVQLSGPTRLACVAAQRIASGYRESPYISKILAIQQSIQANSAIEPMIFLKQTSDASIYVLEGHHRITAYLLAASKMDVLAYVGSTADLSPWKFY